MFWKRLPERDFTDLNVLDFGSGLGGLSIQLAQRGARRVLGIELQRDYCEYAQAKIVRDFPQFSDRITYRSVPTSEIPDASMDAIVSKDVFEHVIGLEEVFQELIRILKPGGEMVLGFGPLWHSPFGDHDVSRVLSFGRRVPWLHLLAGDARLLQIMNSERAELGQEPYRSMADAGFNKLTIEEIESILHNSPLELTSYATNPTDNRIAKLVEKMPKPALLRRYLARTVYCILRKPE